MTPSASSRRCVRSSREREVVRRGDGRAPHVCPPLHDPSLYVLVMLDLLLVELARSTLGSGELNMCVRRQSEVCAHIASDSRMLSERL